MEPNVCKCTSRVMRIGCVNWRIILTCENHPAPKEEPTWNGDEVAFIRHKCSGILAPQFGNCNHPRRTIRVNGHRLMSEDTVVETLHHEVAHAILANILEDDRPTHNGEAIASLVAGATRQLPELEKWITIEYARMHDEEVTP